MAQSDKRLGHLDSPLAASPIKTVRCSCCPVLYDAMSSCLISTDHGQSFEPTIRGHTQFSFGHYCPDCLSFDAAAHSLYYCMHSELSKLNWPVVVHLTENSDC